MMKWIKSAFLLLIFLGVFSWSSAQDQSAVPAKPMQLEAQAQFEGANAVSALTWRDEADNELGFEILRSDNEGEFRVVGMVGANTTKYRDNVGRYVTGAFVYKVRAFNEAGKSEDSNTASVWF